ncbi:indole-3-glycerol phosphate synthase TrpC [Psychroflexus planctonicus]|uniref:Indole-3-glycerol phosphate synthase n=1 Tax=Psychroflexus planctonicus TaxID=1526575 RepID=A0ABQ1SI77_9FLAO|nr:indole-3-glycerol phosphate synthase TrpC [Psychroflexus planctonicus]GGE36736.1 indole-3-glycerol phosphate synthase [Psychroflexus planctonicus]
MHILDKIISFKAKEVQQRKLLKSLDLLQKEKAFQLPKHSITEHILQKETAIIAEFKRKSPSKQNINLMANPKEVALGYQNAGVAGISVLTDYHFFGGSFQDLQAVKTSVNIPILQKDFIIDAYQIYEAKAAGADFILLIAAVLTQPQIQNLAKIAQDIGLEVLVEIHAEDELEKSICKHVNLIGVNNRNLKTFEVNLEHSMQLAAKIPKDFIKVSESGINATETLNELKKAGFQAFLMGESFMKTQHPGETCSAFINQINTQK